ncbi:MAG: ABC transporter permease [Ruminococcus sp.]|nr:ABC transporter permease [Ruminococcus sp.]
MKEKLPSTISKVLPPLVALLLIFGLWVWLCSSGTVPKFMLPPPQDVLNAFLGDFELMMHHATTTLAETFIGLFLGIAVGFLTAVVMDRFVIVKKMVYPVIIISQTIPTIAIAPLLVLWLGFEMLPKIVLIILIVFFPISVSMLEGFASADADTINLMRTMGANRLQIFRYVKIPAALGSFFSGLKIAVSYAVVGAVLAEWMGGNKGLGSYLAKVRKAYSYDKMFAVIILISALSLLLIWLTGFLQKRCMPWEKVNQNRRLS